MTHHSEGDGLDVLRQGSSTVQRRRGEQVIPQAQHALNPELPPEHQPRPLHPVQLPSFQARHHGNPERQMIEERRFRSDRVASEQVSPASTRTMIPLCSGEVPRHRPQQEADLRADVKLRQVPLKPWIRFRQSGPLQPLAHLHHRGVYRIAVPVPPTPGRRPLILVRLMFVETLQAFHDRREHPIGVSLEVLGAGRRSGAQDNPCRHMAFQNSRRLAAGRDRSCAR